MTEKWKPKAEGRGAGSWGSKWEPVSFRRGWGEVSPLPGAGMRAKSVEPGLFRTSRSPGPPLGGT